MDRQMSLSAEAFAGNVILKLYEGVGAVLISKVKEGLMSITPKQDRSTAYQTGVKNRL